MEKLTLQEVGEQLKEKERLDVKEDAYFSNSYFSSMGKEYEENKGKDITFHCQYGSLRCFDVDSKEGFKFVGHIDSKEALKPYLIFKELARFLEGVEMPEIGGMEDNPEFIYKKFYEDMMGKGEISFKN